MNLTEISIKARKMFIWLIIITLSYIMVKFMIDMGIAYYKATHLPPIPGPNHNFNKLPNPNFGKKTISSSGMSFSLELVEGKPPETTSAGKVYSMPKKLPTLLAAEKAKEYAKRLLFIQEPVQLSTTLYRFTDPQDKLRTMDLDITYKNFKIVYDYLKNPQGISLEEGIDKKSAENEVINFANIASIDDSISNGIITYDALKYNSETKKFIPATSLSTANALRVNYFRKNLDNLKILPPAFNRSYNYTIYVPSLTVNPKILEMQYIFWPIAFDDFATYPLRSGAIAWQDLQDGYASVIENNNGKDETIKIRQIYLAYYDSEEPQNYLQPIFVFEGDNNFVAYLPAITEDWLE